MDPDAALHLALDRAYETFGTYPQPTGMEASPLRDPKRFRTLTRKPLRRLSVDELSGYAGWAMTTVGEVEDYKHFLPRILELAVSSGVLEPEIVASKLRYGHWQDWPPQEKSALIDVFCEACVQALDEHTDEYDASCWFCGMAKLAIDLQPTMQAWESASSSNAALQLAQLLRSTLLFENDVDEMGYWGDIASETVRSIRAWLLGPNVHTRLTLARLATASNDIWMLDQALGARDRLVRQQVQ